MKKNNNQADEFIEKLFISIIKGIKNMGQNMLLLFVFLASIGLTAYLITNQQILLPKWNPEGVIVKQLLFYAAWSLPVWLLAVYGVIEKKTDNSYKEKFESIKFCNKSGQYPELIDKYSDGKKEILSFKTAGIPITEWREKQVLLESALDCNILKIKMDTKTKTIITLETVTSDFSIGTDIPWNQDYISNEEFEIVAGEGILDRVKFNFNKYPHALIAGVTGSGKSVLLRLFLWEFICKGATPYMIDFKGGIELTDFEMYGEVVYDRNKALDLLKEINQELTARLNLFRNLGVKNLSEYNKRFPDQELTRIVIACDEVAEMLDKTGLSAADAVIYKEIEKEMSTIARLGRAPGIHMLLGTQRPDAKIIIGQIKNNLPIRISGRMTDTHASEMVLGNTKATSLGETLGRFMYTVGSDTFEFQGYNFSEGDIIPGNYQRGKMLINSENDCIENSGEKEAEYNDEMVEASTHNIKQKKGRKGLN